MITTLPGEVHEWLLTLEGLLTDGEIDDFDVAAVALELKRRADAILDIVKDRQYDARIGVIGESEEIRRGVKVKVVGPTEAWGLNTKRVQAEFPRVSHADLWRKTQRKGYCTISEVK